MPFVPLVAHSLFFASQLVPILFKRDPNQLTPSPDASLIEQLLQSGFDRTFRDAEPVTDLFIA